MFPRPKGAPTVPHQTAYRSPRAASPGRDASFAPRRADTRQLHDGDRRNDPDPPRPPAFSLALVGTFPPPACGLATHTSNLATALTAMGLGVGVIRLVDGRDPTLDAPVVYSWDRHDPTAHHSAARCANRFDAVLLQHEFGIFPGRDGEGVVPFVAACRRPVITTLHTVLEDPSPHQRRIVDELLMLSQLAIVHSDVAHTQLLGTHAVDPARVAIVPLDARLDPSDVHDWAVVGRRYAELVRHETESLRRREAVAGW